MPGFLERDEGEREPPYEKYPWDGVSGVRPVSRVRVDDDGRGVLSVFTQEVKEIRRNLPSVS